MAEVFASLSPEPPDPILALIELHGRDARPDKIDLGIGVYRDDTGATPVFGAVKEAERLLVARQATKTYLGAPGNTAFTAAVFELFAGRSADDAGTVVRMQAPGGTGALRLAFELLGRARPDARVWFGVPTYANHVPLVTAARLTAATTAYYDAARHDIDFRAFCKGLSAASPGDVVLLHGSCNNPTGADLTAEQWALPGELLRDRQLLPFIDMAYHGLGKDLAADAAGPRALFDRCPEALLAYSCSKTFGLYRERTGALFVKTLTRSAAAAVSSQLAAIARVLWSLPPDHGAEIVHLILASQELRGRWSEELASMTHRLCSIRDALSRACPDLGYVTGQKGLFSLLPLDPEQVQALREAHGVYLPASGRINVAGLSLDRIPDFVTAYRAVCR